MDPSQVQIPPPEQWEIFENLSLEIFRNVWNDPTAKQHGRRGQAQCGTDVYGYEDGKAGPLLGVQCKGKAGNLHKAVTRAELLKEIEKAKKFDPPLSSWILATTAPNNERLEELARQITEEYRTQGLFKVQVFGWDDLESFIRKYEDVQRQFYPTLVPKLRNAAIELAEYLRAQKPDQKQAFKLVRKAARRDLAKQFEFNEVKSTIQLGLRKDGEPFARRTLIGDLEEGNVFVVEAGPGAGKTTALLQLSEQLQMETKSFIPIVIPLQDLGDADLLDHIHARGSFHDLPKAALVRLAEIGQIVLLCDSWNELSQAQRSAARRSIRKFRSDFRKCGMLFTTREMTPAPMDKVTTLKLAVPSRDQQIAILRDKIGDRAKEFWRKARAVPDLGEVLRTPLYLAVLGSIGADGEIPETKDEAIRRFLENQETRRAENLRPIFHDRQAAYLEAIAVELTRGNTTLIWDPELRVVVSRVSKQLEAQGQIGPREPLTVIEALVAHHVLVERAEKHEGKTPYAFQHQQFQEWYASHYAEACIAAAHDDPTQDNKRALDEILNGVAWEEAQNFAVERLSRRSKEGLAQCAAAILRSLAIDPMLGAYLVRRAAPAISDLIKESVIRFAKAWYAGFAPDRAVRFMMGTGWPEFSEYVWKAYEDDRDLRLTGLPNGWFTAESLGADWESRYLKLPDEQRRSLLFDLMYSGARSEVDFALRVAMIDPDPSQAREVIEMLQDDGATVELNALLDKVGPDVWKELAEHSSLAETEGTFRDRLIEAKEALVKTDNGRKLWTLLELAEAEIVSEPDVIVELALGSNITVYQDQNRLFSRVNALYPEQLSIAAMKRIEAGQAVPGSVHEFIRTSKDQAELLAELLDEAAPERRKRSVIAKALDAGSVERLIREVLALYQRGQADPAGKQANDQRSSTIEDALRETSASNFAAGLLAVPLTEPWAIGIGARLIYQWSGGDRSTLLASLDRELLDRLRERIKEWVAAVLPHAADNRSRLSEIAVAIKAIASIDLLQPLKALLDADLPAYAAAKEAQRRGGSVPMGYASLYRGAFDAMNGDAVRDVLLGYIGNPLFEEEAAFELVRFGIDGERIKTTNNMGAPDYGQIPGARERRAKVKVPHPVAVKVLDRIETLIASDEPRDVQRAVKMAQAAVQMDIGSGMSTIQKVMNTAPAINQGDFLQVTMMLGEEVDPDLLSRGIEAAFEQSEARQWRWGSQQEWWPIERWLKLLAISRNPGRIPGYLARVPSNIGSPYEYEHLVYPLGHNDPAKALPVLQELAKQERIVRRHAFVDALLNLRSKEAIEYLADLILAGTNNERFEYNAFELSRRLAGFARKYPELREKFMRHAAREPSGGPGLLLRELVPLLLRPEDIRPLIERTDPGRESFMMKLALDGIENLAVADRLVPGTTNVYQHDPQDLTGLRADLFRFFESDHPNAAIAGKFLTSIDRWRDSDGKPPSEPRHPDIASGKPWPREAQVLAESRGRGA